GEDTCAFRTGSAGTGGRRRGRAGLTPVGDLRGARRLPGGPASGTQAACRTACALGGLLLLAACAATPRTTDVGQRMIIPSTAARYEVASHQAFTMPQPLANAVPEFPADYRPASSAPVTVCAAVAVGGDGTVSSVGLVHAAGCVDPAVAPAALEASV